MKSKEEMNELKEELEILSDELNGLTEEEMEQISGGLFPFQRPGWRPVPDKENWTIKIDSK